MNKLLVAIVIASFGFPVAYAQTPVPTDPAQASAAVPVAPSLKTTVLPTSLCGRWTTPGDSRFSQTWCIKKIDQTAGTGRVTWFSMKKGCGISDAPAKVEFDGSSKLKIAILETEYLRNSCLAQFSAELTRNGAGEFVGEVRTGLGDTVNGSSSYVNTIIKAE